MNLKRNQDKIREAFIVKTIGPYHELTPHNTSQSSEDRMEYICFVNTACAEIKYTLLMCAAFISQCSP